MDEIEVQGAYAPPDTKSWFEYSWKLKQDATNRFEDAAKFLVTIISLNLTIFFTKVVETDLFSTFIISSVLISWSIALFWAFMTMFPHEYSFNSKFVKSIKEAVEKSVSTKKTYLLTSVSFYFLPNLLLLVTYLFSLGVK